MGTGYVVVCTMSSKQSSEKRTGIERISNKENTTGAGEVRVEGETLILPEEVHELQRVSTKYVNESLSVSYGEHYFVNLNSTTPSEEHLGEFKVDVGLYSGHTDQLVAEEYYYDSLTWACKKFNEVAQKKNELELSF